MTHDLDHSDTPFSRPLAAVDVPEAGLELTIVGRPAECEALARADGLRALSRLEADVRVMREGAGGLRVTGELRAAVRQVCVVSLEEFDTQIVEPIDLSFAPEPTPDSPSRERRSRDRRAPPPVETKEPKTSHIVDLDEDQPDPLIDGRIDLGAIVAEFLALALDPYPRKPGVSFAESGEKSAPDPVSPFARLRDALQKGPRD